MTEQNPDASAMDSPQAIVDLLSATPIERRARAGSADLSALSWDARMASLSNLLGAAAQTAPSLHL